MPNWAEFLIQFGYRWAGDVTRPRRIALISMPCDSAAAGLVTLGAMIRDLTRPRANNLDGHYDMLMEYARQFLEERRGTGRIKWAAFPRRSYQVDKSTDFHNRQLAFSHDGVIHRPIPQYATEWYVDGGPPPEWHHDDGRLSDELYRHLIPEAVVLPQNLVSSYSGLCLSGRAAGANASKESCAAVRFSIESAEQGLDELLTVYGWGEASVSRVSFYNALTDRLDRSIPVPPALIVADGDGSFLRVTAKPEFQESDIIGVIHRTLEREKLEAVGSKIHPNQWYAPDGETLRALPAAPRGISISVLTRRS